MENKLYIGSNAFKEYKILEQLLLNIIQNAIISKLKIGFITKLKKVLSKDKSYMISIYLSFTFIINFFISLTLFSLSFILFRYFLILLLFKYFISQIKFGN